MGYVKMSSYLELKNITKKFSEGKKEKTVVKNINLKLKKNEFLTILGPSGCGKSTLLKIIAGFIEAEKGQIYKKGKRLSKPGLDRVMLFQDFEQLFSWQSVLANVVFALKSAQKKQKNKLNKNQLENKALEYLKKVKLKKYSSYYPHQLSGGMKQRTALARTLASGAEILLMDEPFASVDNQTRRELQQMLIKIWKEEEKSIVFITHDIREAVFLADRIVVMKNEPGEIIEIIDNELVRPRQQSGRKFNQLFQKLAKILADN